MLCCCYTPCSGVNCTDSIFLTCSPNTAVSPCIGTPSQATNANPATTTKPGSVPVAFTTGILGSITNAFSGIAAQATLSAQQKIASSTNTTSISGVAGNTLVIVAVVILGLFLISRKGE